MCACGHPASDHRRLQYLTGNTTRKSCGGRDPIEDRKPGQRYAVSCRCEWFRMALGETDESGAIDIPRAL